MEKGGIMRVLILAVSMALPFLAFGQDEKQQQPLGQGNEAPATAEKEKPAQPPTKPPTKPETASDERKPTDVKEHAQDVNKGKAETRTESSNDARGQADVKGRDRDVNKSEAETHSSTSRTKVNVEEFRSHHSEVFNLGRHPKEYFVQRYGGNHFRLFGNTYFVFVDGCWVAVDVDGFTYTQRVICEGDPDFVVVD